MGMQEFFQAVVEDSLLQEEILEAETEEEFYEIAEPYIGDMSFDDFCDNLYWEYGQIKGSTQMNEDMLQNITGGKMTVFKDVLKDIIGRN